MAAGWRFGASLAGAGMAAFAAAPATAQVWRFHADHVLGTSFELLAVGGDRAAGAAAAEAARAEIDRLDAVLSGWRDDSELAALNRASSLRVSADLYRVIEACERWRALTGGAFDARQGRAFASWREAVATGAVPDPDRLGAMTRSAATSAVVLDPLTRTVTRPEPVVFAPEALAKGYVIDAALAAARAAAPELAGLMIDIGGDLRCWGQGPRDQDWTLGVADPARPEDNAPPAALVRTRGAALATSGRGPRDLAVGAVRFSHLLAAGGRPAEAVASATAIGPTAAEADALATALCALPVAEGLALTDSLAGMEARIVDAGGTVRTSGGWGSAPARLIRVADAPAARPWPRDFVVTIHYDLPRQDARAYAPYVAIWVTDEGGRLVRALTMLGDDLDYVGENYIWWRRYARSRPQVVAAVTRPTRPPGRYSVVWDGRDESGKPVGQGRYTLHVEAVRENGLHGYQSATLALGSAPAQATAPAEDELNVSTFRYGRRR